MSEVINVQQRLPPMKGDQVIPVGLDGTLANPVADHADSQPTVNSSLVREDSVRNHVHINGVGSLTLPDGKTALVAPMFSLHPETVRLAAYVAFWAMVRTNKGRYTKAGRVRVRGGVIYLYSFLLQRSLIFPLPGLRRLSVDVVSVRLSYRCCLL